MKLSKIKLIQLIAAASIIAVSSPAFATFNFFTPGAVIAIPDTTAAVAGGAAASGQTFSTAVSGGISTVTETYQNSFAIGTTNVSANPKYRNEYIVWSAYSGYYQLPNTSTKTTDKWVVGDFTYNTAKTEAVLSDPTKTPFSAFVQKGGTMNTN